MIERGRRNNDTRRTRAAENGLRDMRSSERHSPFGRQIHLPGLNAPLGEVLNDKESAAKALQAANVAFVEYYRNVHVDDKTVAELSEGLEQRASSMVGDLFSGEPDAARAARVEVFKFITTAEKVTEVSVFDPKNKQTT